MQRRKSLFDGCTASRGAKNSHAIDSYYFDANPWTRDRVASAEYLLAFVPKDAHGPTITFSDPHQASVTERPSVLPPVVLAKVKTMRSHVEGVFDSETTLAMSLAYSKACHELGVSTTDHPIKERIAQKILQIADGGERNSVRLCSRAICALVGNT